MARRRLSLSVLIGARAEFGEHRLHPGDAFPRFGDSAAPGDVVAHVGFELGYLHGCCRKARIDAHEPAVVSWRVATCCFEIGSACALVLPEIRSELTDGVVC